MLHLAACRYVDNGKTAMQPERMAPTGPKFAAYSCEGCGWAVSYLLAALGRRLIFYCLLAQLQDFQRLS